MHILTLGGMTLEANDSSVIRFCALEYRASDADSPSAPENVVIVFLVHPSSTLSVLHHRDWRNIVRTEDQEYIQALMDDFRERARRDPEALFRQISSLSVGPLVTYSIGSQDEVKADSRLFEVWENLIFL